MANVKWTEEQQQAINEKGANILVAAAAGSGKTAVLVERIINKVINEKIDILLSSEKRGISPVLKQLRKDGYIRVRINNEMYDLSEDINLEKNIKSKIDVVVDRIVIKEGIRSRLYESIENACNLANGKVLINVIKELLESDKFFDWINKLYLHDSEKHFDFITKENKHL